MKQTKLINTHSKYMISVPTFMSWENKSFWKSSTSIKASKSDRQSKYNDVTSQWITFSLDLFPFHHFWEGSGTGRGQKTNYMYTISNKMVII